MTVNKADRIKIKSLAAFMGDTWEEAEKFIYVPAWGRVFTFSVREGEEFVSCVEDVE